MKVLVHPDPVALESELLRGVAAAQRADALAGVLIVVPTARLARHLVRRIGRSAGAAAGIEVLHHRGLVRKVLTETAGPSVAPLPETLHAALVRRILDGLPQHPWTQFVRERPGAIRAVLASLTDLREAALTARQLREALGKARRELAELYGEYEVALDRTARAGFADEAGLVAAALPRIPEWVARFREVFHHGAYELTGVHLELMRAIDRERPVRFLIPADAEAPAYETAEAFQRRHLCGPGDRTVALDATDSGLLGAPRLRAMYREEAPRAATVLAPLRAPAAPERTGARRVPLQASLFDTGDSEPAATRVEAAAIDPSRLMVQHAQGARAELLLAFRLALAEVAAGTPPDEVAILARSLEPYAPQVEALLESEALSASTSATAPLRRDPAVHDLLVLLRAIADDFPRRPTCEALTSTRVRWDRLLGDSVRLEADLAESFSVEASIAGGFEEWTEDLPAWAQHAVDACEREDGSESRLRFAKWRAAACRGIARAVTALRSQAEAPLRGGWREHSELVEAIARRCIRGFDAPDASAAVVRFLGLLGEMRALATTLEPRAEVPFGALLAWLESAVNDATIPVTGGATEGVQILDAMQARGLTFRSVFVLGMNGGLFPRPSPEDPLLDDRTRRCLREALGCPIPVKSESDREERMLLALLLGSSRERIAVSWQRADEAGRAKPVSLALREVARLRLGTPDLEQLVRKEARRIPAHPAEALAAIADAPGLLRPDEAELLAALQARNASDARRQLTALRPELDARLALVEAVESFTPHDLDYDGRIGTLGVAGGSISVNAFEQLGACALRYFFRNVLRVDEARADRGLFDFDNLETGLEVHDTLRRVYTALDAEGLLSDERRGAARARLPDLVRAAWRDAAGSAGARLARRAPVLSAAHVAMWHACLLRFLEEDLTRLEESGVERIELETERRAVLPIGEGIELAVHGRLDRVAHGARGTIVTDYKTGSSFDKGANGIEMLRGRQLQVPLYSRIENGAVVELLQVRAVPRATEKPGIKRVLSFEGFSGEAEEGFVETLRVVAALARIGLFPLRRSPGCPRCPYESACRYDHAPTSARFARLGVEEVSRYLRLSAKTTQKKRYLLADVPEAIPEIEEEE